MHRDSPAKAIKYHKEDETEVIKEESVRFLLFRVKAHTLFDPEQHSRHARREFIFRIGSPKALGQCGAVLDPNANDVRMIEKLPVRPNATIISWTFYDLPAVLLVAFVVV